MAARGGDGHAFAHRLGMVTEDDYRAAGCLSFAVAKAETKTDAEARQDWQYWLELAADRDKGTAGEGDPDATGELWVETETLSRMRDLALARLVSPFAVLGVTLTRLIATVPPTVVLPPTIGADASLNLFVANVGPSGSGKGITSGVSREAVVLSNEADTFDVGSGEGIPHLFAEREKQEKSGKFRVVRTRSSVLFHVPEVDSLTALGNRQGATLLPQLRKAWSGEPLGFAYADANKAIPLAAHSYRLCVVLGVQPDRARPLLDDAGGGTPQRFLWLPNTFDWYEAEAPEPIIVAP